MLLKGPASLNSVVMFELFFFPVVSHQLKVRQYSLLTITLKVFLVFVEPHTQTVPLEFDMIVNFIIIFIQHHCQQTMSALACFNFR